MTWRDVPRKDPRIPEVEALFDEWCELWDEWRDLASPASGPPTEEDIRVLFHLPIEALREAIKARKAPK